MVIFGDSCIVSAEAGQMKSLSAHEDHDDLVRFIECLDPEQVKKVFLVHGEYLVQQELSARLSCKDFDKLEIPSMNQEFELT